VRVGSLLERELAGGSGPGHFGDIAAQVPRLVPRKARRWEKWFINYGRVVIDSTPTLDFTLVSQTGRKLNVCTALA
jgi:hypothetical protein